MFGCSYTVLLCKGGAGLICKTFFPISRDFPLQLTWKQKLFPLVLLFCQYRFRAPTPCCRVIEVELLLVSALNAECSALRVSTISLSPWYIARVMTVVSRRGSMKVSRAYFRQGRGVRQGFCVRWLFYVPTFRDSSSSVPLIQITKSWVMTVVPWNGPRSGGGVGEHSPKWQKDERGFENGKSSLFHAPHCRKMECSPLSTVYSHIQSVLWMVTVEGTKLGVGIDSGGWWPCRPENHNSSRGRGADLGFLAEGEWSCRVLKGAR